MTEFRRRYSDQPVNVPRQQISRLAFILAALLIAVTSVSLLFVGVVASHASRQQTVANEESLFHSTLAHHMRAIVREQITIAASDDSVRKLVRTLDQNYARASFHTLWATYRHSKVMLISGSGKVLAESFEDYTHIIERPIAETPELEVIFEKQKELFQSNLVRVPSGFGHSSLQGVDPSNYSVMGFVRIDGKPAIFGAMPIMPDAYKSTLPDGSPTMLLSALYIDDLLLKQLNSQLEFMNFDFVETENLQIDGPRHMVSDLNGTPFGAFTWTSQSVGDSIWPTIIPVIVLLSVALGALAFGIAWRIGQLTSSLQSSERQNRHLALHDTLSGLANRLQFNRVLENAIKLLPDKPFTVIHCDLDKFKAVNDTFGHAAGDAVIQAMAERLTAAVGKPGLVCRVGGDEFMVIYRGPVARDSLVPLCEALVAAGSKPVPLADGTVARVGLSAGVAIAPVDGSTSEEMIIQSDAALYHSKKMGRNRFSFYSDIPHQADDPEAAPLRSASGRPAG
ncbi:diguanylate cyclase [Roseibium sp. AS2]|uniref:sensor domain-containing diguanylate cyclase n=1 Tax=Roseibium sp. AS2 TaxID=3135781 RepID=UPI00316D82E9